MTVGSTRMTVGPARMTVGPSCRSCSQPGRRRNQASEATKELRASRSGDEDAAAAEALGAAPVPTRFRMALEGFGHAHLGLLLAIVAVAAGLEGIAPDPEDGLPLSSALLLGGGAAGYLLADAAFRARLGLGPSWLRVGAAVPVAASAVVGTAVAGSTQIGVVVAVFVALFVIEARTANR